ncbi:MAG: TolC family protein, partial [Verrucomicrobiota bacterium]
MSASILMGALMTEGMAQAPAKTVTIGVVKDGNSWYADSILAIVKQELAVLSGNEFKIDYKEKPFNADFQLDQLPVVLRKALTDETVDVVLCMGVLVSRLAAHWEAPFEKPVLSGLVLDADFFGFAYTEDGTSKKPNFSFVATIGRADQDLEAFRKLHPFKKLHIVLDATLYEGVQAFTDPEADLEEGQDYSVVFVPARDKAEGALSQIGEDAEAVYLTPPIQLGALEWQKLIDELNRRKLPTFALRGHFDVERGVLAGLMPPMQRLLGRRVALNLQRILLGDRPEGLNVFLPLEDKLYINARTAVAIDYAPDFDTMETAELLFIEAFDDGDPLDLATAVARAVKNNVDLAIKQEEVESALHSKNLARSALLPRISANVRYAGIDEDRSSFSNGTVAEESSTVGFSVSQLIYDDEAWTRFRSSQLSLKSRQYEEVSVQLDVAATASARFLQFLLARTLWFVELDNLKRSQNHLELAGALKDVGTSGPEDVYRWEAEVANQRRSTVAAQSAADRARTALNQTLGVDPHKRWIPEAIHLESDQFYFLDSSRIGEIVLNTRDLEFFRQFIVQVAKEYSPDLMAFDELIEAQRLTMAQKERRFILPSFTANFQYDHTMDESFAQSSLPDSGMAGSSAGPDDDEWV